MVLSLTKQKYLGIIIVKSQNRWGEVSRSPQKLKNGGYFSPENMKIAPVNYICDVIWENLSHSAKFIFWVIDITLKFELFSQIEIDYCQNEQLLPQDVYVQTIIIALCHSKKGLNIPDIYPLYKSNTTCSMYSSWWKLVNLTTLNIALTLLDLLLKPLSLQLPLLLLKLPIPLLLPDVFSVTDPKLDLLWMFGVHLYSLSTLGCYPSTQQSLGCML